MKFTISILVKKPQEQVFRYLCSPLRLPDWTQGLQSVKSIKGRRSQVGGQSKLYYKENKATFFIEEEVLVHERHSAFSVFLDHKEMVTIIDYTLEKEGKYTILNVKYTIKLKNLLNRIFSVFFIIPMKSQQTNDLKKLKKLMERIS